VKVDEMTLYHQFSLKNIPVGVCDDAHTGGKSLAQERWGKEAEPLRELLRGTSLAFIQQLTPQARMYQPFLTPAYAQSLSTPALPLRLSHELPTSGARFLK